MLPLGTIHPLVWVPVVPLLAWLDYSTGPFVQTPALYVVPVTLAAWYSGRNTALALAVVLPLSRLGLMVGPFGLPWSLGEAAITAAVRICSFGFLALMVSRLAGHERSLQREVQILEGLLPICSFCRSIRTSEDRWEAFDAYVSKQKQFSHALCPTCARKNFPEYFTPDSAA